MTQDRSELPRPPESEMLAKGEKIVVRDFYGKIVETITIDAKGNFITTLGIIEKERLGDHILHLSGHPAGK